MSDPQSIIEVQALRKQATVLAGAVGDLAQRASVYHHLFDHSGGNHAFPLLAAHGALWASGYFRAGMRFGAIAAVIQQLGGCDRAESLRRLETFANDFRDINRRVCVETYFIYHLTADKHLAELASGLVPPDLLEEMNRCHAARISGRSLCDVERRALFRAFFLWEQMSIVGPSVEQAFNVFDWPLIKRMALRPKIRFAYFKRWSPLTFQNFADQDERIEMGLRAFDRACDTGWTEVERALQDYGIMPTSFGENPKRHFDAMVESVLYPRLLGEPST